MTNSDSLSRLETALKTIFDWLRTTGSLGEKFQGLQRQELEVSLFSISIQGLIVTALIYLALLPLRSSYAGVLLFDRGLTQPIAVFLASTVAVFILQKLIKLKKEFRAFRRDAIARHRDQIAYYRDDIKTAVKSNKLHHQTLPLLPEAVDAKKLWATRYCRVLSAYVHSGSQKTAAEIALDDSSFYLSAANTSYALPRILIWAIPLLGFIGTVVGISQSVNGFSGVLESSSEIEQLKEGIGSITSGLAVAFDTTFLALLLSVLVMIPLVLVERSEQRLLLGVDAYINDSLLSQIEDKEDQMLNLQSQPEKAVEQLKQAALALQHQFDSLEKHTAEVSKIIEKHTVEVSKIIEHQQKVGEQISFSSKDEEMQEVLFEIRDNLSQLKPVLEKLDRPRRITFVENQEN